MDEGTEIFTYQQYEDILHLYMKLDLNPVCTCKMRNPYTTLNTSYTTCTYCHDCDFNKAGIRVVPTQNSLTGSAIVSMLTTKLEHQPSLEPSINSSPSTNLPLEPQFPDHSLLTSKLIEPLVSLKLPHDSSLTVKSIEPRLPLKPLSDSSHIISSTAVCEIKSPLSTSSTSSKDKFQKFMPRCMIRKGTRFSDVYLDKSFLKEAESGLSRFWPGNINNVDDYFRNKNTEGSISNINLRNRSQSTETKKPEVNVTIIGQEIRAAVSSCDEIQNEDKEKYDSNERIKLYDVHRSNRCRRFLKGNACIAECKFLHVLPKEDGVICKHYYLHMKCNAVTCPYLHTKRCCEELKEFYFDKWAASRCSDLMKGRTCIKSECAKIHRYPKDDGVYCLSEVTTICHKGRGCKYLHAEHVTSSSLSDPKATRSKTAMEKFLNNLHQSSDKEENYVDSAYSEHSQLLSTDREVHGFLNNRTKEISGKESITSDRFLEASENRISIGTSEEGIASEKSRTSSVDMDLALTDASDNEEECNSEYHFDSSDSERPTYDGVGSVLPLIRQMKSKQDLSHNAPAVEENQQSDTKKSEDFKYSNDLHTFIKSKLNQYRGERARDRNYQDESRTVRDTENTNNQETMNVISSRMENKSTQEINTDSNAYSKSSYEGYRKDIKNRSFQSSYVQRGEFASRFSEMQKISVNDRTVCRNEPEKHILSSSSSSSSSSKTGNKKFLYETVAKNKEVNNYTNRSFVNCEEFAAVDEVFPEDSDDSTDTVIFHKTNCESAFGVSPPNAASISFMDSFLNLNENSNTSRENAKQKNNITNTPYNSLIRIKSSNNMKEKAQQKINITNTPYNLFMGNKNSNMKEKVKQENSLTNTLVYSIKENSSSNNIKENTKQKNNLNSTPGNSLIEKKTANKQSEKIDKINLSVETSNSKSSLTPKFKNIIPNFNSHKKEEKKASKKGHLFINNNKHESINSIKETAVKSSASNILKEGTNNKVTFRKTISHSSASIHEAKLKIPKIVLFKLPYTYNISKPMVSSTFSNSLSEKNNFSKSEVNGPMPKSALSKHKDSHSEPVKQSRFSTNISEQKSHPNDVGNLSWQILAKQMKKCYVKLENINNKYNEHSLKRIKSLTEFTLRKNQFDTNVNSFKNVTDNNSSKTSASKSQQPYSNLSSGCGVAAARETSLITSNLNSFKSYEKGKEVMTEKKKVKDNTSLQSKQIIFNEKCETSTKNSHNGKTNEKKTYAHIDGRKKLVENIASQKIDFASMLQSADLALSKSKHSGNFEMKEKISTENKKSSTYIDKVALNSTSKILNDKISYKNKIVISSSGEIIVKKQKIECDNSPSQYKICEKADKPSLVNEWKSVKSPTSREDKTLPKNLSDRKLSLSSKKLSPRINRNSSSASENAYLSASSTAQSQHSSPVRNIACPLSKKVKLLKRKSSDITETSPKKQKVSDCEKTTSKPEQNESLASDSCTERSYLEEKLNDSNKTYKNKKKLTVDKPTVPHKKDIPNQLGRSLLNDTSKKRSITKDFQSRKLDSEEMSDTNHETHSISAKRIETPDDEICEEKPDDFAFAASIKKRDKQRKLMLSGRSTTTSRNMDSPKQSETDPLFDIFAEDLDVKQELSNEAQEPRLENTFSVDSDVTQVNQLHKNSSSTKELKSIRHEMPQIKEAPQNITLVIKKEKDEDTCIDKEQYENILARNSEEEYILFAAKETLEGFKGRKFNRNDIPGSFSALCKEHNLPKIEPGANCFSFLDKNIRLFWAYSFSKKHNLDLSTIHSVCNVDMSLKRFADIMKKMESQYAK